MTQVHRHSISVSDETGVAKAGADGHGGPCFRTSHARNFRKALNNCVVVHDDEGWVIADAWYLLAKRFGQVEMRALPIAPRQVLATARDRSVGCDNAGTADADDGGERQLCFFGLADKRFDHTHEMVDGRGALRLVFGMTPEG